MAERCPACGHLPGEHTPPPTLASLPREELLLGYAVELTGASTTPGEPAEEVGKRLRIIHGALQTLEDGERESGS